MSGILIFGGGGIAEGIVQTVGGFFTSVDVTDYRAVRETLTEVAPDVVINCAGISFPGRLGESSYIVSEINTNLIGSFNVAHAAVDAGVETFIFIASVAGLHGKPNHAGYSASKAGVISLVQSLAHEGHNAYAISPGRVNTRMRERDYPGEDVRTRLEPTQVGEVVRDVLDGKYDPGSNVIIRRIGFETYTRVDDGEPWKTWLRVGQPVII